MSTTPKANSSDQPNGWSLLAYMAGDNNLSADMAWALQSMKEYLDNYTGKEELEVIAQYDPNRLKPRVLKMSKPKPAEQGVSGPKPGEEDGNLDTAVSPPPITLKDMFDAVENDFEAVSNHLKTTSGVEVPPVTRDLVACRFADLSTEAMLRKFIREHLDGDSRRYMLVLSGHGAGVSGDFLTDEDPHSSLMISRLGEILRQECTEKNKEKKTRIDILGMDSCLMGMAEVACEVKDHVRFLVGSEGFVNNTGWPYHRVLNVLAKNGDPKSAAKGIVEKYAAFYQDYEMSGSSTQIAALNLDKLPNLAEAVKKLVDLLVPELDSIQEHSEDDELAQKGPKRSRGTDVRDAVILAHWYAQSFKWGEYADLWDFCDQLRRFLPKDKFEKEIEALEDVKKAIEGEEGIVIQSRYCGPEFQHAHGIAIYFPWSALAVPPSYRELKFAQATGWHNFLNRYLKTTRRMRRGDTRRQLGYKAQIPRRFGPDVEEVEKLTEELAAKTGPHPNVRSGFPFGSKTGTHSNVRSGSPNGTRSGSPYGTRMLGGTLIVPADFQNVPDGYLRQALSNPDHFTGDEQKGLGAAASK